MTTPDALALERLKRSGWRRGCLIRILILVGLMSCVTRRDRGLFPTPRKSKVQRRSIIQWLIDQWDHELLSQKTPRMPRNVDIYMKRREVENWGVSGEGEADSFVVRMACKLMHW